MSICIWVDCDDVLSETVDGMLKRSPLVEKWMKRNDITSFNLYEIEGADISKEEAVHAFYSFFESAEYLQTQPVFWAYEKLYERKKQWHNLFVVTWRPSRYENVTRTWIETHFPWIFSDYLFMNQYTENEIPKSQLCKEKWIQLLIDDSLSNINDVNWVWIPWFLLDNPWNQWVADTKMMRRVYTRDEIDLSVFFGCQ